MGHHSHKAAGPSGQRNLLVPQGRLNNSLSTKDFIAFLSVSVSVSVSVAVAVAVSVSVSVNGQPGIILGFSVN